MTSKLLGIYQSLLDTPTIFLGDVPACARAAGLTGTWPALERGPYGTLPKYGNVYFGRTGHGLVKVGFSMTPDLRMFGQWLGPIVVIVGVQPHHERAMHALLANERVFGRELFAGAGTEAFIAKAKELSTKQLRDWICSRGSRIREAQLTDPAEGEKFRKYYRWKVAVETREEQRRIFRAKARAWFARTDKAAA